MMEEVDFKRIVNQLSESVVILNKRFQVIYVNSKAREYDILTSKPIKIGEEFSAIVSTERKEIVSKILQTVISKNISESTEAEYKDTNGRTFFFEISYDPIVEINSDEVESICVSFRDITSEKIFQKKSIQLLKEHSSVIENANAIIFSIDSRMYITEWNMECTRLTRFSKNETLTRKVDEFISPVSRPKFNTSVEKILAGEAVVNFEVYFNRKDGDPVLILLNATAKVSSSGNVVGILFVGHDITELSDYRRSLEQKVEDRTEKLKVALEKEKELVDIKNRFVSIASHEFRIPLSTISNSVNSIKSNTYLRSADHNQLQIIEKQLEHMRLLIDDILTLGKTETKKIKADIRQVDIVSFLKKLIDEVSASFQHSHKVNFDFNTPFVLLDSDEKLLRNIFVNLISNAIKFSPESKSIDIILSEEIEKITVKIKDQGVGIAADDLERIFEPFNRGKNVEGIKGTGLGLTIVKKAVETIGGRIDVESEQGRGTQFTVKFRKSVKS